MLGAEVAKEGFELAAAELVVAVELEGGEHAGRAGARGVRIDHSLNRAEVEELEDLRTLDRALECRQGLCVGDVEERAGDGGHADAAVLGDFDGEQR